ncbi:hypothetical protein V2J09_011756 [Rumex salicifolius]
MDVVFDKTVAAETIVANPNLPTLDVQSVIEPYVADIESDSDSDADTEVESDCSDEEPPCIRQGHLLSRLSKEMMTLLMGVFLDVESALKKMWPNVSRRYCGTHLCANFKKDNLGKPIGNLFWNCCKAFSEFKFKKAMEEIEEKAGKNAIAWLKNGISGVGLDASVRRTIMGRHCLRQEIASKMPMDGITEDANRKLAKAEMHSRSLKIFKAAVIEYEVLEEMYKKTYSMNYRPVPDEDNGRDLISLKWTHHPSNEELEDLR